MAGGWQGKRFINRRPGTEAPAVKAPELPMAEEKAGIQAEPSIAEMEKEVAAQENRWFCNGMDKEGEPVFIGAPNLKKLYRRIEGGEVAEVKNIVRGREKQFRTSVRTVIV